MGVHSYVGQHHLHLRALASTPDADVQKPEGYVSEVARILSYMSAGVGALELLLNPMAGQLSDKYGRRNFLLLSPIINFFNKLYVAFNPSLAALAWERD